MDVTEEVQSRSVRPDECQQRNRASLGTTGYDVGLQGIDGGGDMGAQDVERAQPLQQLLHGLVGDLTLGL
jgi:hypothetical protein